MTKFVGLKAKTSNCLTDGGSEDKKSKGTKKCVIKTKITVKSYKNCSEATQLDNKIIFLEENKVEKDSFKKMKKNS